jgi:hypothetical protein
MKKRHPTLNAARTKMDGRDGDEPAVITAEPAPDGSNLAVRIVIGRDERRNISIQLSEDDALDFGAAVIALARGAT